MYEQLIEYGLGEIQPGAEQQGSSPRGAEVQAGAFRHAGSGPDHVVVYLTVTARIHGEALEDNIKSKSMLTLQLFNLFNEDLAVFS
jgi:hypothetical protein